jgi:nicotinamidase-related amidase
MASTPAKALLLIDLINTWRLPGGAALRRQTRRLAPRIAELAARVRAKKWPVIYTNDNFGRWRSDFAQVIEFAEKQGGDAAEIAHILAPESSDYFVLKPRHSAFYQTPLEVLLDKLSVRRLVMVGVSADQCLLATASDALLREYEVQIPGDLILCPTPLRTRAIRRHFKEAMDIDIGSAAGIAAKRKR